MALAACVYQSVALLSTLGETVSGEAASSRELLSRRSAPRSITEEDRDLLCNATAHPFSQLRTGSPIRWLHIPKTGTSLMHLIWRWGCDFPDPQVEVGPTETALNERFPMKKFCPRLLDYTPATHKPIGPSEWAEHSDSFVTMLREPGARACSAYMNGKHCVKDCNTEFDDCDCVRSCSDDGREALGCAGMKEAATLREYVGFPEFPGCASKMMAGVPCNEIAKLPTRQTAIDRLHNFKFVGLVEEWELSVCLFHRLLGGEPHPDEFGKTGAHDKYDSYQDTCTAEAVAGIPVDADDSKLYETGTQIFWSQVQHAVSQLRHA